MARMMRGQQGVVVSAMKMNMAEAQRVMSMQVMQQASEAQCRSAAVRALRAVMARMMKGDVAMRVEVWRSNIRLSAIEHMEAMRAAVEAEMKAGQCSAALKLMAVLVAGMMGACR